MLSFLDKCPAVECPHISLYWEINELVLYSFYCVSIIIPDLVMRVALQLA